MSDDKPQQGKDPTTGRFLTGNNGGGRPKGSRSKLGEDFLQDMQAAWREQGAEVIRRVIAERPQDFLKTVASLLPQQMEIKRLEQEMTDEELSDALGKLDQLIALARSAGGGKSKAH